MCACTLGLVSVRSRQGTWGRHPAAAGLVLAAGAEGGGQASIGSGMQGAASPLPKRTPPHRAGPCPQKHTLASQPAQNFHSFHRVGPSQVEIRLVSAWDLWEAPKAGALGGTTPPTRHLRYYHIIPGPYSQSLCLPPASSSLPDLSCVPPFPACSPSCPGLLRLPSSSQRFHPLPPQTLQGLVFSQALLQVASSVAGQTHSPTGARGFASRPRAMGYHLSVGEGGDTPKSLLLGL